MNKVLLGVLALLVLPAFAAMDDAAKHKGKRGYWFYEEPPPVEEAEPEEKPQAPQQPLGIVTMPPPPSEDELLKMPVKQVEKLLEDYRDFALLDMSPQSVTWYYQVQDFARRRARAFMNVTEVVMLQNPDLNMNTEYPVNAPGRTARTQQRASAIQARLGMERGNAALLMLTSPRCGFCEAQRGILRFFVQKHQWPVREVDILRHPEAVARFGTDQTPSVFLIMKGSDQWMPVAVGVESMPKLEENAYRALRMLRGETQADQWTTNEYQDGGLLDPRRR